MQKSSQIIYYKLSNETDVTNIVDTSIFALQREQLISAPAITYQLISLTPHNSKGSVSDLDKARVQVNCYTTDYSVLVTLSEAVRSALEQPDLETIVIGSSQIKVQCITFEGLNPSFDNNADNEGIYYCSLDFILTYGR